MYFKKMNRIKGIESCSITPILSPPFYHPHSETTTLAPYLSTNHLQADAHCPLKLLMARLPTIFLNCFKFTLHQGIFDQVLCFSSLNPRLDTPGVTCLFLQPRHASGTLYHLIFDLVFVLQNSSLFSKLILCHRFSMTNFVVSVFLCVMFCFWFYCALNTQQGGYVRITSLIIIIIIIINNTSYSYYYLLGCPAAL